MIRTQAKGIPVCLTVTHLDALVMARSGFHHSVNYRSVVVLGRARTLTDEAEKRAALDALVEHVIAGRTRDARGPNPGELAATDVIALDISEASAKVRSGGPVDAATVSQLFGQSQGNALYLRELVRGSTDAGALKKPETVSALATSRPSMIAGYQR